MSLKENYTIKQIDAKETHLVRHPVLRTGKPIETCIFEGDDFKTTIHLGLYKYNNLIGVTTFMKSENNIFSEPSQYQLRGMAILSNFQRKGLGAVLISEGENILKKRDVKLLWCNAREIAVNFYERNGFIITGQPFEIAEIGTHYIMYKYIGDNKVT